MKSSLVRHNSILFLQIVLSDGWESLILLACHMVIPEVVLMF